MPVQFLLLRPIRAASLVILLSTFANAFGEVISSEAKDAIAPSRATTSDREEEPMLVAHWVELATKLSKAAARGNGAKSIATVRARTWVTLAMFEAANACDRHYASFLGISRNTTGLSSPAAVIAAAHEVLTQLYPAEKVELDQEYELELGRISNSNAKAAAIGLGRSAAIMALQKGGLDPRHQIFPYRPVSAPGSWESTIVPTFEPFQLALTPWFLKRANEIRLPGPPSLKSRLYARDYNESKVLGGKNSHLRTIEQTRTAQFWDNSNLLSVLRQIASTPGRSTVQNARLYALWSMAQDDVDLAVESAKLHFFAWRPFTAIRNGDRDGNPATRRQADWEPLLFTPWHPEYPCWHCATAAATETVLSAELGEDLNRLLLFTSSSLPGAEKMMSLHDYAREVSLSRIYAGLHFRSSCEDADALGHQIAAQALLKFAPPSLDHHGQN